MYVLLRIVTFKFSFVLNVLELHAIFLEKVLLIVVHSISPDKIYNKYNVCVVYISVELMSSDT